MKTIVVMLALVALSGCSLLTTASAPKLAKAVNRYCAEPYQERLLLRNTVNDMIKPNSAKVTCEGDPQ